jgi:hypothetical protein
MVTVDQKVPWKILTHLARPLKKGCVQLKMSQSWFKLGFGIQHLVEIWVAGLSYPRSEAGPPNHHDDEVDSDQ